MRRTVLPLLCALFAIAATVACGDEASDVSTGEGTSTTASGGASTTAPGGADDLEGRTFVSQSVTVDGADKPLAGDSPISLSFSDGQLGASAGCNRFGGTYTLDGGVLTVRPLGGTEMGCAQALMDQDTWLTDLLASSPTVTLEGDQLTVMAGDTVIVLLDDDIPNPDRELVGTRWNLQSIVNGAGDNGSVSSVPAGVEAWVEFADDGTFTAELGCNRGSGDYSVDGNQLVVGDMGQQLALCGDPGGGREDSAEMTVEQAMTTTLKADPTFAIVADQLSLRTTDGGLDFRAAE